MYKVEKRNDLYFIGDRRIAVIHARLRMGSSQLNSYLHQIGVRDSPICACGDTNEDVFHYFFVCPNYNNIRIDLHEAVIRLAPFTTNTLLYGCSDYTFEVNKKIFKAVQIFIEK